jgi:hypothetical protein
MALLVQRFAPVVRETCQLAVEPDGLVSIFESVAGQALKGDAVEGIRAEVAMVIAAVDFTTIIDAVGHFLRPLTEALWQGR